MFFYVKNDWCELLFKNNTVIDELNIYIYTLLVCLSVHLYPINVKTAEPIRPKFYVAPHVTPGKEYDWSKFFKKILCLKVYEIRKLFYCFFTLYKEKMLTDKAPIKSSNPRWVRSAHKAFIFLLKVCFMSSALETILHKILHFNKLLWKQ